MPMTTKEEWNAGNRQTIADGSVGEMACFLSCMWYNHYIGLLPYNEGVKLP